MIGPRLKQLRQARGLSLEALAAEMGGIVTKQALSKYEQGKAKPSQVVLNKLAASLGVKSSYFWGESPVSMEFTGYRKGSGLRKRDQEKIESLVTQTLEERIGLQHLLRHENHIKMPCFSVKIIEDVESAAEEMRKTWALGVEPIASVVDVLEEHRIHVLEIQAGEKFDGISAIARDRQQVKAAAVVTRRGVPGERQRLNLAHELGHLVLKISPEVNEEKAAFRFGAAFLAPAMIIRREIGANRSFIQAQELLLLKQRFGLSIQALLYRLRDLDIITESYYRQWCIHISRLGWRKQEPMSLLPERPKWLRQAALHAFSEGAITQEDAERMLGEPLHTDQPLSLVERRAFMKLPIEERRRILAEQAEQMATHYEQDPEWKELQGGDIVES